MNVFRPFAALVVLAAALAPAVAEDPKDVPGVPCRAELVAKTTSLKPGVEATIGVRLVLAEHWHVYWKNPGESGIPTSVEWALPKGYEASPIKWPAPRRLDGGGGLVAYGYEKEVVFPVTLKVPADAKPGDVVLAAKVTWLVCREICEPGDVRVELKLPVKDDAPLDDAARAEQFAAAAAALPRALPVGAATIESSSDHVTLTVNAAELADGDALSADFFPAEQLVLDDSATPVLESTKKTALRLRLTPAPRRDEPVKRLTGVLTVKTTKRTLAFDIDAPATSDKPGQPGEKSPK